MRTIDCDRIGTPTAPRSREASTRGGGSSRASPRRLGRRTCAVRVHTTPATPAAMRAALSHLIHPAPLWKRSTGLHMAAQLRHALVFRRTTTHSDVNLQDVRHHSAAALKSFLSLRSRPASAPHPQPGPPSTAQPHSLASSAATYSHKVPRQLLGATRSQPATEALMALALAPRRGLRARHRLSA